MKGRFQPTTFGNMASDKNGGYVCFWDYEAEKRRADVLAATIRELRGVVTHDAETKEDFISRVRAVLSADPDARLTPNAKG